LYLPAMITGTFKRKLDKKTLGHLILLRIKEIFQKYYAIMHRKTIIYHF
jgi:hypothetical protein